MGEAKDGSKRELLKALAGVAAMAAMPRAMAQTPAGWQPSARYPDPTVKVVDPSFNRYRLGLAKVERIASNCRWNEGPVWFGDGRYLLWSDIPNNRLMRWDEQSGRVSEFRKPSNNGNGNTRDRQGRVFLQAETGGTPDGFRLDVDGNLWMGWGMGSEALDGVNVFNSEAKLIGRIELPERCANLCFGGLHRNRLFMAASTSVYSLYVNTQGAPGG